MYTEITFICITLQLWLYFGFINDSQQIHSLRTSLKVWYCINNQVLMVGGKLLHIILKQLWKISIIQLRVMTALYVLEYENMKISYSHLNK